MLKMKNYVNVLVSESVMNVRNTKNTDKLKPSFLIEKLYEIC